MLRGLIDVEYWDRERERVVLECGMELHRIGTEIATELGLGLGNRDRAYECLPTLLQKGRRKL